MYSICNNTLAERVASELGYYYRMHGWSVRIHPIGMQLHNSVDPSVNLVVKNKKRDKSPLLIRVETKETISSREVHKRWRKMDKYVSQWYLFVPEGQFKKTYRLIKHMDIKRGSIVLWKEIGNQIVFEWFPGVFRKFKHDQETDHKPGLSDSEFMNQEMGQLKLVEY